MPKFTLSLFALALTLSAAAVAAPQNPPLPFPPPSLNPPSAPVPYRHGYYLFLADTPIACEQCYVPLLLTIAPLEEIAKDPAGQDCDLITTYERDSIYLMNGIVHVAPADIAAAPRTIRVRKRNYRYQEITAAEILHLLEHPLGTIPVSRTFFHSDLPPGPPLDALIAALRAVK
jgi:hypothetical protein